MFQRISFPVICFLGILAGGTLLPGVQVHGHDCIEAALLRSPVAVIPGQPFGVQVGVFNGGQRGVGVQVNMFLVTEDLRRTHIGGTELRVGSDSRAMVVVRCQVPRRATPGRYQLVMVASTRGGVMKLDRKEILIVHREPGDRDLDLVIEQVLDSHGREHDSDTLSAMVSDVMTFEGSKVDLRFKDPQQTPKYFSGRVDKITRDRNNDIVEIKVVGSQGHTESFDITPNTTFPNGDPVAGPPGVGSQVDVTYTGSGSGQVASDVNVN